MEPTKTKSKKRILFWVIIYAIACLVILFVANTDKINGWLSSIIDIFTPAIIGLVLSYLTNPFFRLFEHRVLYKVHPHSLRRILSLTLAYLSIFLILFALVMLVLPQLIASIEDFIANIDTYLSDAITLINSFLSWANGILADITDKPNFFQPLDMNSILQAVGNFFANLELEEKDIMDILGIIQVDTIISSIIGVFGAIADVIFGFFFSVYLLSSKEKRYAQIMKLRRALFSDEVNARITKVCTVADRSFGNYLEGKLIDSLIVGVLVYIIISIVGIPYAILIATFVAITDMIPVIGPFIGVIPSAVIILLTEPGKVIPFLLIILIVQQIDGNIIAPAILGNKTDVSSLCVLFAITTMGAIWGLMGMLLAVPIFATVLTLLEDYIEQRLQKKGLPTGTENYYSADSVVNPTKDTQETTDKIVRRFERRVFHLRKKADENGRGDLTRFEKFQLASYALARKYHLFSEPSDEVIALFAAEEAAIAAAAEADKQYEELTKKSADTSSTEAETANTPKMTIAHEEEVSTESSSNDKA